MQQNLQDIYFKHNNKHVTVKGRYYTCDVGDYFGLFHALSDNSLQPANYGFVDINYNNEMFANAPYALKNYVHASYS